MSVELVGVVAECADCIEYTDNGLHSQAFTEDLSAVRTCESKFTYVCITYIH